MPTPVETITPATPFSRRLRDATLVEHRRTEQAPFIRRILGGKAPMSLFAAMTGQWHALYGALEGCVRASASDPIVAAFDDPALDRREAIEADLAAMLGDGWRTATAPLPSTAAYAARLHELAATDPSRLIAHHYLRYLGDLSGGQIIAKVAGRTYGLTRDAGLRFYAFDGIADAGGYKSRYRTRLDEAPWDEAGRLGIVDEVDRGYRMTATIFAELDADPGAVPAG